MIEYTKLFALLESRNMKRTDLLSIISSGTLAKIGKNQTITTDTIDKLCLFLEVQPNDIMEVYDFNDQGEKVVYRSPDAKNNVTGEEYVRLAFSELNKYLNDDGYIDMKKWRSRSDSLEG